jgi:hypothetical protein
MTFPEGPIETPPRAASPVHGFGTLAVHAGSPHDPVTGAVIEAVSWHSEAKIATTPIRGDTDMSHG